MGATGATARQEAFEWWWEPIALKRFCTAMLHFMLSDAAAPKPADLSGTFTFPSSGIFVHRTPRYFASVSTRRRPTGLFRYTATSFKLTKNRSS